MESTTSTSCDYREITSSASEPDRTTTSTSSRFSAGLRNSSWKFRDRVAAAAKVEPRRAVFYTGNDTISTWLKSSGLVFTKLTGAPPAGSLVTADPGSALNQAQIQTLLAAGTHILLLGQNAAMLSAGILVHQSRHDDAYAFFYKATWNQAWAGAAYHALAEIDSRRTDWVTALDHLDRSLRLDTNHLRARALRVMVLRHLDRSTEADTLLAATLALDPLDGWARHLSGHPDLGNAQARLDLAHNYARAGFFTEAISVLEAAPAAAGDLLDQSWGSAPIVVYTLGYLHQSNGDKRAANPRDARAPYYLSNLLYDRRRHTEAIRL